jgi:lipopolysaccharide/colanic/teichoic acid biosynthesis glycosyltransferase
MATFMAIAFSIPVHFLCYIYILYTMAYKLGKRMLDILGAATGAAVFLPLVPVIAVAIKVDSPGPVIVGLPRVSRGKLITINSGPW